MIVTRLPSGARLIFPVSVFFSLVQRDRQFDSVPSVRGGLVRYRAVAFSPVPFDFFISVSATTGCAARSLRDVRHVVGVCEGVLLLLLLLHSGCLFPIDI